MANKVEILNLDINTSALISKMTETRAKIEELNAAQKQLTASNQKATDEYQRNVVELGRLNTSYNQQKAVVTQLTAANNSLVQTSVAITEAVGKENLSIAQARENNTQLLALRNQINIKTAEGQAALAQINAKLDQNNQFIRENVSAYEQQKIGIGDYRTAINGAIQDSGLFGGQLQSVTQVMGSFTPIMSAMKTEVTAGATQMRTAAASTEGMTLAQKGLTVATNLGTGAMRIFKVALAATGIGLVIGAIALLIGYFKTFDPLVDKVEQGLAAFGAVIRVVQVALGSFITGLSDLGGTLKKVGSFLANPIQGFKDMGNAMSEAASEAATLKEAQQDLIDQQNIQEVANAKASQQYNELILQSKNRTLSEKERLKFLQQAEAIETENFNQRSALAEKEINNAIQAAKIKGQLNDEEIANLKERGVEYATYLLNLGKITDDEVEAIKKAQLSKIAIQDESTKRLEKNQNSQDKLADDAEKKREKAAQAAADASQKAEEAKQKRIDASIQKSKDELEVFIQLQGIKKKSVEDEIAFEKQVLDKKLAILKKEFDAKKITQTQFQAESLALTNEFAKKQADIAIAEAARELENFKRNHQTKIDDDKFFTEQKLQQLIAENEAIKVQEIAFQQTRLEQGQINQQEYNDAIDLINENTRIKNEEAQKTRDEAKKEQQAIDLENQRILDEEKFTNDFDLQLAREEQKYQAEIKAAEKTGSSKDLITKKHADVQAKIEQAKFDAQLQSAADTFGAVAGMLAEGTAAQKAAAIAQATINTYQGVTAILSAQSVLPEPAGGIAKGLAAAGILLVGLKNVQKIASTKIPSKAGGGLIGDVPTLGSGMINTPSNLSQPLNNGDDVLAYVGNGEMILNKEQQARAGGSAFFRSIGVPTFAGGGQVAGNTSFGRLNGVKVDTDGLAERIALANQSLPAPVVSVVDIADVANKVNVIENGASF